MTSLKSTHTSVINISIQSPNLDPSESQQNRPTHSMRARHISLRAGHHNPPPGHLIPPVSRSDPRVILLCRSVGRTPGSSYCVGQWARPPGTAELRRKIGAEQARAATDMTQRRRMGAAPVGGGRGEGEDNGAGVVDSFPGG